MSEAGRDEDRRVPVVLEQSGFELATLDDAWRFGEALIRGRMVPSSIAAGGPGAVVGIIQAGRELGLPPMFALSNMTFTNGRVGLMGDAAKAVIRARGGLTEGTDFRVTYSGEEMTPGWTATVSCTPVRQREPVSESFSLGDAIRAGLCRLREGVVETHSRSGGWGGAGPWSTYTRRMLYYRALGFLVRDHFSHLLSGAVICEELSDYQRAGDFQRARDAARVERDVTPREPDPLMAMISSPRQGEPEGSSTDDAMPQQADPAPSSPAAATSEELIEIDPETGEVIPADLPREPEPADPRDAAGFVHAGKAAAELVDEMVKSDPPAAHADAPNPFATTPAELAAEQARAEGAPISRAQREHLVAVLAERGKRERADALRFVGTVLGRAVRSTEDLTAGEYARLLAAMGTGAPAEQGALL